MGVFNNITTLEQALACEELWDVENGITLAEEFHKKFHRIYGNSCTHNDLEIWLNNS